MTQGEGDSQSKAMRWSEPCSILNADARAVLGWRLLLSIMGINSVAGQG